MAANDLTVVDVSTILNSIYAQATGDTTLTAINTSDFTTVATTTLKTGYDVLLNSISQVLSKTIFSVRPYTAKFKGLEVSNTKWGNHVRKLSPVDPSAETNPEYALVDGNTYSPFVVNKPEVLQTNFYGADSWIYTVTIPDNQLDIAFSSADELGSWLTMTMTNVSDTMEQARENMARAAINNFIAGKKDANNGIIHLVTEYNAVAGTSLTSTTVRQPQNFVPFMKWAYGRIKTLAQMMSNRSQMFHLNVTGKEISRHTPADKLKLYMLASDINDVAASVLSSVYHDDYLKLADYETVAFWQAIDTPASINSKATYIDSTGALKTMASAAAVNNIFGVMFDEDAIGINFVEQTATTDRNGRHRFTNWTFFENQRYYNDFTENGLIFLLD